MGIYKQAIDCKYSIDRDVLILSTGHGQYKFKIENPELLESVHSIATLVVKELRSIEEKQSSSRDGLNQNHYATLLLATLNICEKYTKLEKKYQDVKSILGSVQSLKEDLQRGPASPAASVSSSPGQRGLPDTRMEDSAARRETHHMAPGVRTSPPVQPATAPAAPVPTPSSGSSVEMEEKEPEKLPQQEAPRSFATCLFEKAAREVIERQAAENKGVGYETQPAATDPGLPPADDAPLPEQTLNEVEEPSPLVGNVQDFYGGDEVVPPEDEALAEEMDSEPETDDFDEGFVSPGTIAEISESQDGSGLDAPLPVVEDAELEDEAVLPASVSEAASSPAVSPLVAEVVKSDDSPLLFTETSPVEQDLAVWGDEPPVVETGLVEELHAAHREPGMEEEEPEVPEAVGDLDSGAEYDALEYDDPLIPQMQEVDESVDNCDQWSELESDGCTDAARQYMPESETGEYQLPLLSFLRNTSCENEVDHNRIRTDAELLEKKLGYFGIKGEVMGIHPGPVITTYEYRPDPGIKISKIVNLADDLALALSAYSIRIVAPIPGKDVMGIEIPNIRKSLVPFIDIVTSDAFRESRSKVPICLGKDIVGNPVVVELESMPHLLIAGATGTGKSVGLNAMITSILYKATPDEVRFLMIDPKRIELSFYNDIPHLLTPVITDMNKANIALQWMVREMDRRYNLLAEYQVRHIEQFNQKLVNSGTEQYDDNGELLEQLPYIVVIIDELADLMMTASRDIEFSLTRLAQMARAAGIHLILATQRPSVDVLTGIIKANFPTRISFQVSSKTDSRTIIDANGAETLLGNGDMLFVPPGTARLTRVHGTYVSEAELSEITTFIKRQRRPEYIFDVLTEQDSCDIEPGGSQDEYDEKYNEALEFVMTTRQASISGVQRALRVGYNRAARIIDLMEKNGIVGPSDGIKPRKVLTNNLMM